MDVPKNRGTPKWMVKIMENLMRMDDLGVPIIFGNTQMLKMSRLGFVLHFASQLGNA